MVVVDLRGACMRRPLSWRSLWKARRRCSWEPREPWSRWCPQNQSWQQYTETVVMNSWSQRVGCENQLLRKEVRSRQWLCLFLWLSTCRLRALCVYCFLWQLREYWMIYSRPGFMRSYDLAPQPPPPPSPVNKLSLFLSLPVCCRSSLLTGEGGEGVGMEPNNFTGRKPGPP